MQIHYKALSYRIELYLHDYKLPIKIDENGHSDRNIEYKINQQKAIYQEFGCKFIRIDPDKEDFDIFRALNQIVRQIKQSTKKTLISKISTRLLGFKSEIEFKSDNIIKSKATKFILKKILPVYEWQWKRIVPVVKNILRTKIEMLGKLNKID